jgi:carbamoyltransferase
MQGTLLGPAFLPAQIRESLATAGATFEELDGFSAGDRAAQLIADGQVVGWFQGRMEFGPRALGARSILADARGAEMQSRLNMKVKFREGFRPFAPSVLSERKDEYFELGGESPYMTIVAPVAPHKRRAPARTTATGLSRVHEARSDIPAVTHLDYSARVQTVSRSVNPSFHHLISSFAATTGCALVVNTSFNVRGEPIVCSPADALACFARTAIDALVIGPFLVARASQREDFLSSPSPRTIGLD